MINKISHPSSEQRSAPRLAPSYLSGVRYEHLLAGVSGGVMSTCILHPLELLKIRFEFLVCIIEYQPPAYPLRFAVSILRGDCEVCTRASLRLGLLLPLLKLKNF